MSCSKNCGDVECDNNSWTTFYRDNNEAATSESDKTIRIQICEDILINANDDPDKLLYYNRIMAAEPLDSSYKYHFTPPEGIEYIAPPKYNYPDDSDEDIYVIYLGMNNIGNVLISIKEISVSVVLNTGVPGTTISDMDRSSALAAYNDLAEELKQENGGQFRPPSDYNFDSLNWYTTEYLPAGPRDEYTDEDWATQLAKVSEANDITDENRSDRMGVFIRLFCEISLLQFADIKLGLIMEVCFDMRRRCKSIITA